jgi:hypothetical protein
MKILRKCKVDLLCSQLKYLKMFFEVAEDSNLTFTLTPIPLNPAENSLLTVVVQCLKSTHFRGKSCLPFSTQKKNMSKNPIKKRKTKIILIVVKQLYNS